MRYKLLPLFITICANAWSQSPAPQQDGAAATPAVPLSRQFHVRYVNGQSVYIDGGRDAGLAEGTKLVIKQDPAKSAEGANASLEPGVVAKLTVISVASISAVCQVDATARDIAENDVVSMPDQEVEKLVEKQALGSTRKYPMVVSFSEGDPLDEEVRETIPRPPLPEVNEMRGRFGIDVSTIRQAGQGSASASTYGFVFRGDFTRIAGTHWNLNGYWRGSLQRRSSSQSTIQDSINRTYLMSLTYINPQSTWTASIGRFYVPWASSLDTIDGAFAGKKVSQSGLVGMFAGSTPDPTAWDYNPQRRIGGVFFNAHGGNYESFHYSSTVGGGVNLIKWDMNRPFMLTENELSYRRAFSFYHSMQIDKPTPNPTMPAINAGVGRSLLSLRVQVHPRVNLDLTHTYFRDVPTYDAGLVGTGLLDKYLYQGVNGGARISLPRHITGYFSLGQSNDSNDKKNSLNELFGVTMSQIWKTGLVADARYSKFDSAFASGTYRSVMLSRDLGDRFRINAQGGRYAYSSSLATTNNSNFVNVTFDTNLGSRMFVETMFSSQRGGAVSYDQWINTVGFRFDNRARNRRLDHATHP